MSSNFVFLKNRWVKVTNSFKFYEQMMEFLVRNGINHFYLWGYV